MKLIKEQIYTAYQMSASGLPFRYEFECIRPYMELGLLCVQRSAFAGAILRTKFNPGRNPERMEILAPLFFHPKSTLVIPGKDHLLLSIEEGNRCTYLGCFLFQAPPHAIAELVRKNVNSWFALDGKIMALNPRGEHHGKIAKQVFSDSSPIPDHSSDTLAQFTDWELEHYGENEGKYRPNYREEWWAEEFSYAGEPSSCTTETTDELIRVEPPRLNFDFLENQ